MSLQRLLLRRMIVAMLKNGSEAPYPTLAEGNVFDSKIDSLNTLDDKAIPIISVYTDKDVGFNYRSDNYELKNVEIIIEFRIASVDPEGVSVPTTDFELEIKLDMLEQQIKNCINNLNNPITEIFQNFVTNIEGWNSNRIATEQSGLKFAARQIQFFATICDDEFPPVEAISHADNVANIRALFAPINIDGHLDKTLDYLANQIKTPVDPSDKLETISITSNGVESSVEPNQPQT
ncbi:MAG: hypothetical protein HRU29_01765 [Rhizobiales bacterium]|nr:hypothetical protein [Hyphomicrobiales bacterium]NRB13102.1 hypothetical protein [Hyphomicrobiales bacterium]